MGLLGDLLGAAPGSLLLVSPPDTALAEAAGLKPRPSIVSGMRTAEPAACIVWWPEAEDLTEVALARLRWLLENSRGLAWVIIDPAEGLPAAAQVTEQLASAGLTPAEQKSLGGLQTALRIGGDK